MNYKRAIGNTKENIRGIIITPKTRMADFQKITFSSRREALNVLNDMLGCIHNYGFVTLLDLYDFTGITGNFRDAKYGWTDLKSAKIRLTCDRFVLDLPDPIDLDEKVEDTTGSSKDIITLTIPNSDEHINKEYIYKIGTTINLFGDFKKVISVRFTVDDIIIELR